MRFQLYLLVHARLVVSRADLLPELEHVDAVLPLERGRRDVLAGVRGRGYVAGGVHVPDDGVPLAVKVPEDDIAVGLKILAQSAYGFNFLIVPIYCIVNFFELMVQPAYLFNFC